MENDIVREMLISSGVKKSLANRAVIDFDMEVFKAKDHADELRIGKGKLAEIDVKRSVDVIVKRYFKYAEEDLIPALNSLKKLELILNSKDRFNKAGDIRFSFYVSPLPALILYGVVLALACKKKNYKDILASYCRVIQKRYEPGEKEDADLALKIIKKYEPAIAKQVK